MLNLVFQPFPTLETERLLLRRVTLQDAPQIFILRSDPEILRYIGRDPATTVQDAVDHIQLIDGMIDTNDSILWGIALRSSPDTIIGTIGYWRVQKEHHRSEIGYVLHPDHWNKGIMKEALNAVVRYAFNEMGLHSIEARIDPANIASAQLLRGCGFVEEGYFKEDYLLRGRFVDTQVFSLVNKNQHTT